MHLNRIHKFRFIPLETAHNSVSVLPLLNSLKLTFSDSNSFLQFSYFLLIRLNHTAELIFSDVCFRFFEFLFFYFFVLLFLFVDQGFNLLSDQFDVFLALRLPLNLDDLLVESNEFVNKINLLGHPKVFLFEIGLFYAAEFFV